MAARYITAVANIVRKGDATQAYDTLSERGFLSARALAEREQVVSLIQTTVNSSGGHGSAGPEPWGDVQDALSRAGYLSPKGLTEGMRLESRR